MRKRPSLSSEGDQHRLAGTPDDIMLMMGETGMCLFVASLSELLLHLILTLVLYCTR